MSSVVSYPLTTYVLPTGNKNSNLIWFNTFPKTFEKTIIFLLVSRDRKWKKTFLRMIKNFGIVSIASLKTQGPIPSISNKKFLVYQIVKTNLQTGSYKL